MLITGGADVRHILKTLAKQRCSAPGRRFRFYVHESVHEVMARHLLFLQIINNTAIPIRERMELFLSLHGNSMVREKDNLYVAEIAKELIELMTEESLHPLTNAIDLSHLKHKDRDILQDVFKSWLEDVPFDVEALRENRCRGYYRDRYDHRKNMFDFDYQSHIKPKAGIINWFHYKEFCFTGVAFETRLGTYKLPNRTLSSHTQATDRKKGTTIEIRGFWGDIINSPYHCFGTTTHPEDRARLFKISGSMYRHTEGDLAEFNVTSFITEMETGCPCHLPPESPGEHEFPYSSPLEKLHGDSEEKVVEVEEPPAEATPAPAPEPSAQSGYPRAGRGRRTPKKADWPSLSPGFAGCEVVLLAGDIRENLRKSKYRGLFHRAFVGAMSTVPFLEEMGLTSASGGGDDAFQASQGARIRRPPRMEAPDAFGTRGDASSLGGVMREGAVVVFETMKYQAHFDASARLAYRHRVAQLGHLAGWRLLDERKAVPRIEHDMKESRARELETDATDFLQFVTAAR